MGVLGFLFGNKPKLTFTKDGRVRHEHADSYWTAWKNRFSQNPNYNWKNHSGMKKKAKKGFF